MARILQNKTRFVCASLALAAFLLRPEPVGARFWLGADAQARAARETPPEARKWFEEARKRLGGGEVDRALAAVQEGLRLAPRSVEGLDLAGIIETRKGDYGRAIDTFQEALRLDPQSAETHNDLGNTYFAEEKFGLAEQQFRETLRDHPRNRDATHNLGLVLLARGDARGAITFLRRVQPPDSGTLLNLVQAYFGAGQYPQALELAKSISTQGKNDVRLHFTLGVLLASQKQYEPAIREFELADASKPGTYEILHDLGKAYLRTGHDGRAEEVLGRALQMQPDSADTLYLLAQAYADQGKDVQALELLLRARRLAPQNTDVVFLMSRLSMKQSFFDDAIQLLEEGLKISPRRSDLHAALGESYFTVGKVDKAIGEFETLIRLDPSAQSYAFMGLCYRHLGRFDEAKKYFDEGLKNDPHNVACLYNLGFIENKRRNYAGAEKLLERALERDPDYPDALFELASVKMAEKKYADALPLLRRCAKWTDKPAAVYYKLATAERNLHETGASQRDVRIFETLAKDPAPGPYPFQYLFEYLDQRAALAPEQKTEVDLEELLRQVDKYPDQPRNLYLLAEVYLKLRRVEEARKTVEQLDRLSRGDARTALGVGVLLARYRLYPEAIQHFQMVLSADPASDDAKYNLADVYFQSRDYTRALETIQQISREGQNDDAVLALLGDVDAHLGRTSEAISVFEKAVEKNPDNDQGYFSLALTQMRAGAVGSAARTLRRGLSRIPDSGKLFWGMGVVSVLEGNNAQAEAEFKRAADLMPDWQSCYSALGIFYYESGRIAAARETLDRCQRLFPHSSLNVTRIRQTLDQSTNREAPVPGMPLAPEARLRFLQVALTLAEQP